MNGQILNALIQNLQLRWQLGHREFIRRYAELIGISLILIIMVSIVGTINKYAWEAEAYYVLAITTLIFYGTVYFALLYPLATLPILGALFGRRGRIVMTNARVPELAPKFASVVLTIPPAYALMVITLLVAIPAFNLYAYYVTFMAAGSLAFMVFNRSNRGRVTRFIAIPALTGILIISLIPNILPVIRILWNNHVVPEIGVDSVSASVVAVPGWIGTIFWVVLALFVLAVVVRLLGGLLSGVLGAASGVLNTLIKAIAAIAIVAIIVGGLGYSFYLIGSSSASAQTTSLSIPTVGDVTQVTPGKWEIKVPANQDWFPIGIQIQKGQKVTFQATGMITVLKLEDNPNPPAGFNRSQTPDGALNGGGWQGASQDIFPVPAAPQFSLVGRIDNGEPFFVGSSKTVTACQTGTLSLGVNDNDISSNEGFWTVTITVN